MSLETESGSPPVPRKPRLSFFFATAGYVGYWPKAPGTWGALVGVLVYAICAIAPVVPALNIHLHSTSYAVAGKTTVGLPVAIALAVIGVCSSHRVAIHTGKADPQFVVIDEVSGQFFTYLFALASLNWKYLALGFILFRVFDIWKPFPARQAEFLRGGWGIMADDWVAAVYAAIGIWIARGLGL